MQNKQEYILVYKKSFNRYAFTLKSTEQRTYPEIDESGIKYRIEQIGEMSASGIRGRNTMIFSIAGVYPKDGNQWKYGIDTIKEFKERDDLLIKNGKAYFRIREHDEEDKMEPFWSFISKEIGTAENAKAELKLIIGENGFETVKPVSLIKKLIFHSCINNLNNDIILDFFSGSASTAHAVMQLNAEDGGNRKFIMVQVDEITYDGKTEKYKDENGQEKELYVIDEKTSYPIILKDSEARKAGYWTIPQIGKERIRRAGTKIQEEQKAKNEGLFAEDNPPP